MNLIRARIRLPTKGKQQRVWLEHSVSEYWSGSLSLEYFGVWRQKMLVIPNQNQQKRYQKVPSNKHIEDSSAEANQHKPSPSIVCYWLPIYSRELFVKGYGHVYPQERSWKLCQVVKWRECGFLLFVACTRYRMYCWWSQTCSLYIYQTRKVQWVHRRARS